MSIETIQAPNYQARRKKYVDTHIQGRLIAGLLLLEVLLFAVAMWFVYQELQNVIDNNLYRVHQPDAESSPVLLGALLHTIPWIILVNALILVGIDRLWGKYLVSIIGPLRQMIARVSQLDLRRHSDGNADHVVLEHARQWEEQERQRCRALRGLVQSLPEQLNLSDHEQWKKLSVILTEIRQHLPK